MQNSAKGVSFVFYVQYLVFTSFVALLQLNFGSFLKRIAIGYHTQSTATVYKLQQKIPKITHKQNNTQNNNPQKLELKEGVGYSHPSIADSFGWSRFNKSHSGVTASTLSIGQCLFRVDYLEVPTK